MRDDRGSLMINIARMTEKIRNMMRIRTFNMIEVRTVNMFRSDTENKLFLPLFRMDNHSRVSTTKLAQRHVRMNTSRHERTVIIKDRASIAAEEGRASGSVAGGTGVEVVGNVNQRTRTD